MSQADASEEEDPMARPLKKRLKPQRPLAVSSTATGESAGSVPIREDNGNPQRRIPNQQGDPSKRQLPAPEDEPKPPRTKQSKKAQILQQLPAAYKSKLGSIGFCKWGKRHHPAVIMSPFQLPKKSLARKAWKELFVEKRSQGPEKLGEMSFLVYWYGEPNLELCYNLVPQRDFVLYEDADPKMLAYCRKAHLKQSQNLPLSKAEERRLTAMGELQADLERLQQQEQTQQPRFHQPEPNRPPSDDVIETEQSTSKPKKTNRPPATDSSAKRPPSTDSSAWEQTMDTEYGEPEPKNTKPHKQAPPPTTARAREENNGMGTPQQLKKRPRGRPPLGKVWDPVHGEYVSDSGAVASDLKQPPRHNASPPNNSPPAAKKHPPANQHDHVSFQMKDTPVKTKSPARSRSDSTSKKSKKKKKRKRADSLTPNPPVKPKSTLQASKGEGAMTKEQKKIQLMEKMLEKAKIDAKAELKREMADVMTKLPSTVHEKFGQVGFARWGKVYLPALVLNPYSVPPGPVRDVWVTRFREYIMHGEDLSSINLLVFWYGELDVNNFYSMVPSSSFVSYGQATDKMLDFAAKAESKRASGKHLTHDDQQRLRAIKDMEEDLSKMPAERKRGVVDFQERHDLLTMSDMEDIDIDSDDEFDLCSAYDDGYSSLEDSEDDLNDDRECLSSSSSEDGEDDGIDESDEEFETSKEPKSAILDDSSDEDSKKMAKKKKSKKTGKHKRIEEAAGHTEKQLDNASGSLGDTRQVSSEATAGNTDNSDIGGSAADKPANINTSSVDRCEDPPSPPPAKKAKAAAAAPEESNPSNHAASSKVIPDDESGSVGSDEEEDIVDEQRSKSKVPRRVYVEEEEEQSELQYSDAGAFTEDEPSEVASAPRSTVLGVARAAFAQAQASGNTASLLQPAGALSAMATAAGLPSNSWEHLKPMIPDITMSEVSGAGTGSGKGEKHPVFAMFNQIVQQVCQERDSALQKVSKLQALLEEKQEREKKSAAAAECAAAAHPPSASSAAAAAANDHKEDEKKPSPVPFIPPPDELGKKKKRKKKRRRDDEDQGGRSSSGSSPGPHCDDDKSTPCPSS